MHDHDKDPAEGAALQSANGPSDWDRRFRLALVAHQQGRAADAERLYRQLLAERPGDPHLYRQLALLARQFGYHDRALSLYRPAATLPAYGLELGQYLLSLARWEDAITTFRGVLAQEPGNLDAVLGLSAALMETGQLASCEQMLRDALAQHPKHRDISSNLAECLQRDGRLEEAERLLTDLLVVHPDFHVARANLGIILRKRSQFSQAIPVLVSALLALPNPSLASNLAQSLLATESLPEGLPQGWWLVGANLAAEMAFTGPLKDAHALAEGIFRFFPDEFEPRSVLAYLRADAGQFNSAQTLLDGLDPDKQNAPIVRTTKACQCLHNGDAEGAQELLENVLTEIPDYQPAMLLKMRLKAGRSQWTQARHLGEKILARAPRCVPAQHILGTLHLARNEQREAELRFRSALGVDPDYTPALVNVAAICTQQKRLDEAKEFLTKVLALEPTRPTALTQFALYSIGVGELQRANAIVEDLLAENAEHISAKMVLAYLRQKSGDTESAKRLYEEILAKYPESAEAHFNLGLIALAEGRWKEGWEGYEHRFAVPQLGLSLRFASRNLWRNEDLEGKTLYLWIEQGLGDQMQMWRFIPRLTKMAKHVILGVSPELRRLAEACLPKDISLFTPGKENSVPMWDYHCPLMSLPHRLGIKADDPTGDPYLFLPTNATERARQLLQIDADDQRLKIGLVWSGNPQYQEDRYRSMPLSAWHELAVLPNVALYSLQKGPAADELEEADFPIVPIGTQLADFLETAAVVQQLDLVISVDTSVAHCAGALGKPVWIALPAIADWRWLERGETTNWYRSARLFRQRVLGDWNSVTGAVLEQIHAQLQT